MSDEQFKTQESPTQPVGNAATMEQVYIMWNLLQKKLQEMETVAATIKILLETGLSGGDSNNNLMLPGQRQPVVYPLPE